MLAGPLKQIGVSGEHQAAVSHYPVVYIEVVATRPFSKQNMWVPALFMWHRKQLPIVLINMGPVANVIKLF